MKVQLDRGTSAQEALLLVREDRFASFAETALGVVDGQE